MCEKCDKAKQVIQEWADKQGHERCWYYPDLFNRLAELFDVQPSVEPCLPSRPEFELGCCRYQDEEYGPKGSYVQQGDLLPAVPARKES